MVFANLILFWK